MKLKVLLVDDSPIITRMLKTVLESQGMQVIIANNGMQALTALYNQTPQLIFLDIMLPDISGQMICRIIKQDPQLLHIPIILLTGQEDPHSRFWGLEAGASCYMAKEYCKPKELLQKTDQVLQRHFIKKAVTANRYDDLPEIFSHVCQQMLAKLEELDLYRQFCILSQQRDDQTASKFFQLLSHSIEFTTAMLYFPLNGIVYRYLNLPTAPTLCAEMCSQLMIHEEQIETVLIKSPELQSHENEAPADQQLKSFFLHPVYRQTENIAIFMLGSAEDDLLEEETIYRLDRIIPMLNSMASFIQ